MEVPIFYFYSGNFIASREAAVSMFIQEVKVVNILKCGKMWRIDESNWILVAYSLFNLSNLKGVKVKFLVSLLRV